MQTFDRALLILSLFSPLCPELTVAHVARTLGIERSVASRLLAALEVREFVSQDPDTGRFRLGVRTLDLGALYLQSHRLVAAATPYLELAVRNMRNAPTARSNLFVLDHGEALRLASYPARPMTRLRVPAHGAAAGKVLLAGLADRALERVLATRGLPALTAHTITDPAELREHLTRVRAQGYARDEEELRPGSYCYAAPICDVAGRTVAAVSLSHMTARRVESERAASFIDTVCDAGRLISESLGSGLLPLAVGSPSLVPAGGSPPVDTPAATGATAAGGG